MKKLKILLLLFFHLGCTSKTDNTDCMDCGGGLLDGYLYKEVTLTDIPKLSEIAISANIGNCIRFKMDGENFDSAEIVENCCCNLFI
tara:strand:+ start:347 stop:607 length:261 start_codon:yes stop_codon:yes gene_type:complete